jgi:PKD repeat protein
MKSKRALQIWIGLAVFAFGVPTCLWAQSCEGNVKVPESTLRGSAPAPDTVENAPAPRMPAGMELLDLDGTMFEFRVSGQAEAERLFSEALAASYDGTTGVVRILSTAGQESLLESSGGRNLGLMNTKIFLLKAKEDYRRLATAARGSFRVMFPVINYEAPPPAHSAIVAPAPEGTEVLTEDFETDPWSHWDRHDNTSGAFTWENVYCDHVSGSMAADPFRGGTEGKFLSCSASHPTGVKTWIYNNSNWNPIDLKGATQAWIECYERFSGYSRGTNILSIFLYDESRHAWVGWGGFGSDPGTTWWHTVHNLKQWPSYDATTSSTNSLCFSYWSDTCGVSGSGLLIDDVRVTKEAPSFPACAIQASATTGTAPLQVNFTALTWNMPPGATYQWGFTNELDYTAPSTANTASYTYSKPGWYHCRLRVRDETGKVWTNADVRIEVSDASAIYIQGSVGIQGRAFRDDPSNKVYFFKENGERVEPGFDIAEDGSFVIESLPSTGPGKYRIGAVVQYNNWVATWDNNTLASVAMTSTTMYGAGKVYDVTPGLTLNGVSINFLGPLVMIHGINSDDSAWDDWNAILTTGNKDVSYYGWICFPVNYDEWDLSWNTIGHAVATMVDRDFADLLSPGECIPWWDIVSHSMGGLVSRVMLSNYYYGPMYPGTEHPSMAQVNSLVMLGTPNSGSFTDPSGGLHFLSEGEILLHFNTGWTASSSFGLLDKYGIPVYAIAGTPEVNAYGAVNDGWVSIESAFRVKVREAGVCRTDYTIGKGTMVNLPHEDLNDNSNLLTNLLATFWINGSWRADCPGTFACTDGAADCNTDACAGNYPKGYGWDLSANNNCNPTTSTNVSLSWSAPASGGMNPPQNLQATTGSLAEVAHFDMMYISKGTPGLFWANDWQSGSLGEDETSAGPQRLGIVTASESNLSEQEPNGCITTVGGTDNPQTLTSGITLSGSISSDDSGCVCLMLSPTQCSGDYVEDWYLLQVTDSDSYTLTLSYASGADLDLLVFPSSGGQPLTPKSCSNPEVYYLALYPGTYVLAVNRVTYSACPGGGSPPISYTLTISGSPSNPTLLGYDLYRAITDTDSAYVKMNSSLISVGQTNYADSSPLQGLQYYRAKAIYDQGTSSWSNSASAMVSNCSLTCSASAPQSGQAGNTLAFTGTATTSNCTSGVSYHWDFGDGSSSSVQSPNHVYLNAGTFTWTFSASAGSASCPKSGIITINPAVNPPAVTSMVKKGNPFRVIVAGSNLQSGIQVSIGNDSSPWATLTWKSPSKVVVAGGSSLKSKVPKGTPVQFRFRNPDGGEATFTFSW